MSNRTVPLKNLNIRNKVLIATLIPPILLAIALSWIIQKTTQDSAEAVSTTVSFSKLETSKENVKNHISMAVSAILPFYEQAQDQQQAQQQALKILSSIRYEEDNYIFVYNYDGTLLVNRTAADKEGENLMSLTDINGKPVVKDLIDIAKSGGDFYQYTWLNPSTGNNEAKISYAVGLDKWGWMIGTGVYLNHINEEVSYLREQISDESRKAVFIQFITIIVILILASGFGLLLSRIIAKPIQDMAIMAGCAANGDFTQRIAVTSSDEMGVSASKFNSLLDKIHNIMTGVNSSANQLASSATELNRVSQKTYDAISQQDSETTSIASSVELLSASAKEIAKNGETVKNSANDAGVKTNEGAAVVKDNLASVKSLAKEIAQAAEAVGAVEKRTSEIQSMLEVIHSVTEQTNLLALNAAIEAARAGEQGRGFAVVADEVRSLAMRSAESAEEIRKIIEGLTSDTQSAVETMNASKERSEENLERTQVVADSLEIIERSITSILEKSADIAEATDEQNTVAQEISSNLDRIQEISATSANEMKTTKEASQNLDNLSKDLLSNIRFFKFK
ncbi:MAG: cache domain-containing protein [Cellvibrionaceae bacterium]|nr:cache domain-containing protein [Cellvibrionaceae bacterium]